MYKQATRNILVSVEPMFLTDQSDPDENYFVWAYRIEIENKSGGWFHPVHIHLVDFKVVSRKKDAAAATGPFAWECGPKDVIYVGEGEKVQLLMRFSVAAGSTGGRYMIHCHNLVHEDHDMMQQYRVGNNDPDNDPNDPIYAALPSFDDQPPRNGSVRRPSVADNSTTDDADVGTDADPDSWAAMRRCAASM